MPVPPGRTWPRSSDGTLGGQLKIQVGAEGGKMSTHAYLLPGTERGYEGQPRSVERPQETCPDKFRGIGHGFTPLHYYLPHRGRHSAL